MFWRNDPDPDQIIQFKCHPDNYGHIPEPYPARHFMPEWYKKLDMFYYKTQENGALSRAGTVKRCPPVLDALSAGWIIPLAADVEFTLRDDGAGMSWICGDGRDPGFIAQAHDAQQLVGHPRSPRVPIKFINHWQIKTPPGWSVLFVPPLNREEKLIELVSGIVETDKYFEYINFPGHITPIDDPMQYVRLEQGHPLIQVIPFKRGFDKNAKIGVMNDVDLDELQAVRDTRGFHTSHYRDRLWVKK